MSLLLIAAVWATICVALVGGFILGVSHEREMQRRKVLQPGVST